MIKTHLTALRVGAAPVALCVALASAPAYAQDDSVAAVDSGEVILVTGSRIARPDLEASSPLTVVQGDDLVKQADLTVEQYLNTLPQVNAAGGTTSNNPPNGGRANIDLRGLGANRNIVLLNGRRPMVSASDQTVDVNTIPQALIQRVDIITGGAGAAYGADAVAGVVNFIVKDNFEGLDVRGTMANSFPEFDSKEYQISATAGLNFDDNRGNIAVSFDYSNREELGKVQRDFARQATSTTPTPPTGRYVDGNNAPTQAAIDALFASYGVTSGSPTAGNGNIGFNSDGSLFGTGIFNNPADVTNFRYGADSLTAAPNLNFFPDFYSYNFDIVNVLVLPLERKSAFATGKYEFSDAIEVFGQGSYTNYTSATGSAPTPLGTSIENADCGTIVTRAQSNLVNCFRDTAVGSPGVPSATRATVTGIVVPVTNPFIPADLAALLASRTGNDISLAGSGATEPFRLAYRFLPTGLRRSEFDTTVKQLLGGVRGEITDGWNYEAYYSWGKTSIDTTLTGGVNVQNVQALVESPTGGTELCDGGFNPFGIQPLSADCVEFVDEFAFTQTDFTQKVAQAYITGDVAELPAGTMSVVFGAEHRKFIYNYDPGSLQGPIAGPNAGVADAGTNRFLDFFGELLVPVFDGFELDFTVRNSDSKFNDTLNDVDGGSNDWTYGATASWEATDYLRLRASYQHAVRAPNFSELFSGGSSFPQYFDPCSVTSQYRLNGGADARALCMTTGLSATAVDAYVQTPGTQVFTSILGNRELGPEKADTFTAGAVFSQWGFTASLDYYNISISDTITPPNPNALIAACYGYFEVADNMDYCATIIGNRTPDISQLVIGEAIGGDEDGNFLSVNQGKLKTSGVDFSLGYGFDTPFVNDESGVSLGLNVNYLIDYKVEELPGLLFDYSDTVAFFGAGLGQTFPRWKGVLTGAWDFGDFSIDTRIRYIDAMRNRAEVIFPGETSFTGVPSVVYVDLGAQAEFDKFTLRVGATNLFDKQPPSYAPNVQSGTDPSVYDVIGRRLYISGRVKF